MPTGPLVVVAATVPMSQMDAKSVCTDLEDLGMTASFGDTLERRGAGELWQFILQTNWADVRDGLIASGLAAGVPAGLKTLAHSAKRLSEKFGSFRQKMPQGPGTFIIRDTRNGVEFHIPAQSATEMAVWLKLLEQRPSDVSLLWDEANQEWVFHGDH